MSQSKPIDIASRLELMVDDFLIERLSGAQLTLHHPTPREIVMVFDRPWEGNMCGYFTVFQDDGRYRMYHQAWHGVLDGGKFSEPRGLKNCSAESTDGIHWTRPELGLFEFGGSTANNIVWVGEGESKKGVHGFAPFKDPNPAWGPEARYKAVGAEINCAHGLFAMMSPDGLHWAMLRQEPIITSGAFDSQNLVFWDGVREEYRAYVRDFRDGRRCIRTAISRDFLNWTDPVWLTYPGAPDEQLYTNQVTPYYRAPHIFVGFPSRYVERRWSEAIEALPELEHRRLRAKVSERYGAAVTDGLFMSSRDGATFRRWPEAFIRPGLRPTGNWAYGDNYQAWGIVETDSDVAGAPRELSVYATEGYWREEASKLRRFTLRVDGFVSVQAPLAGGEMVTRPLVFKGRDLLLNFSASAAGSIRVEVLRADADKPFDGFALEDCVEVLGDDLARAVRWKGGAQAGRLEGKPVRLRFVLRDADLYSIQFK